MLVQVTYPFSTISDHRPILFEMEVKRNSSGGEKKDKPFKFEKVWVSEEVCKAQIRGALNTFFEDNGVSNVA